MQDGAATGVQDETAKGVQEAKGVVCKLSLHERYPGAMEKQERVEGSEEE